MTSTDNLRLEFLTNDTANDPLMSGQHMHLVPSPDIPNPYCRISTPRENQVQSGMLGDTVYSRQMPMIITYYLVVFQIPAFHRLVLRDRIQIRVFTMN
jgi:hypothetical protein